jgi:hypothetical protein
MKEHNIKMNTKYTMEFVAGSSPDPRSSGGRRNLYCLAYDACLDTAVQNNWSNFSCSRSCPYIQTYDPPDVIANNPDHWELYDFYLW